MRLVVLPSLVLLAAAAAPSMATAAVRYASPSGSSPSGGGPYCTQAAPCDLVSALNGAGVADGDTVTLAPGSYMVSHDIETGRGVNIRGPGPGPGAAVIDVIGSFYLRNPATTVSNLTLKVHGVYGFAFFGRLAERLVVMSSGASLRTCSIFAGELRDSVCTNDGGVAAVFAQSYTEAPSSVSATLRNVTAYGVGGAYGLDVGAVSGQPAAFAVTNSIIRSDSGVDIRAFDDQTGGAATVTLDHSSFGSVQSTGAADSITAPGTDAGNQTVAPRFVNPGGLDLHEASGSPTIDAGTAGGVAAGELDTDGQARTQGAGPDIGAYELADTTSANPVASFSFTPVSPMSGQPVSFDAGASSGPTAGASISSYAWSFGDGASATGATVSHAYARPGNYTVALTVTDGSGRSATVSHQVQVSAAGSPAPVPPAPVMRLARVTVSRVPLELSSQGVRVRLYCGDGNVPCTGTVTLGARVRKVVFVHARHSTLRRVRIVTVTLGRARFAISPGRSAVVVVGVSRSTRSLVRRAGRGGLRTEAIARTGANVSRAVLRLFPGGLHGPR